MVVDLQPGTILVQRPIVNAGGLAQAGIRQIVVQRPAAAAATLQQLRAGQLLATRPPAAVPPAALANTVQPMPAAAVQNQPKKGLSLTVTVDH